MNRRLLATALLFSLGVSGAHAEVKAFTVDPVHSSVLFTIRHLYTDLTGRFNRFSGTVTMDPQDLASMKIAGTVDIASIDTANSQRDEHLRTPDFFDAKRFGAAHFESTKVTPSADGKSALVTGALTIRDITRDVRMRLDYGGYGPAPKMGNRLGFRLTGTIRCSEYGISYNVALPSGMTILGDEVTLSWSIEAVETAASASGTRDSAAP